MIVLMISIKNIIKRYQIMILLNDIIWDIKNNILKNILSNIRNARY